MVCNYGLVNGLSRKDVLEVFSQYGQVYRIIMLPHKSYCFVCYTNLQEAMCAYDKVNGKKNTLLTQQLFYLIYTKSGNFTVILKCKYCNLVDIFHFSLVPKSVDISFEFPSGLEIVDNFITVKEETNMLEYFKEHWSESSKSV